MKLLGSLFCRKAPEPRPIAPPNGDFVSHIGQDNWVAEVFKYKKSGFFLDFGAFDGLLTSNTYFLEKHLGWFGICVEPNPTYYAQLCGVRNCVSVNVALFPESRKSMEFFDAHGLSCFSGLVDGDTMAHTRRSIIRKTIYVDTLNPTELLGRFSAPEYIDYMSLDIEGAEAEVLKALDLEKYKIALMTIEHAENQEKKAALIEYLAPHGYESVDRHYDTYFYNLEILKEIGPFQDPIKAAEKVAANYIIINS